MKVHTFLPLFSGFYHSIWEYNIESEEGRIIEYYNEENGTELSWDDFNWTYDFVSYSKAITEGIMDAIKDEFPGLVVSYEFEELIQPKEYNFSTDSVNILLEVDKAVLLRLIAENKDKLTEKIKENYTSYDGFYSSYSNNIDEWIKAIENEEKECRHKVGAIIGMLSEDDFEESSISEHVNTYEYIEYEESTKQTV